MAKIDHNRLTEGEKLFIYRRRNNLTQEEMASRYGITRNVYGRIERDEEKEVSVKIPKIEHLELIEKCVLYRKQKELTQEECAESMGITRFWFNQMETGKVPIKDLVDFWENEE